MKSEVEVENCH